MTVMAEAGTQQYRQELTVRPKLLAGVRRIVAAHLRLWGREEIVAPAALCTTELLSNVVKHAGSPECVLTLQSNPHAVRITVSDVSTAMPVVKEPDWISQNGRGMFLLSATADAWGAEPTESGKDVWFEICSRATSGEVAP
ncbi:ATP-binding protein [Streptomyces nigrescens]|uniref:ATP-binding protein n=1 Tax=Streptomyces nigrescens TaxID=1920 RepID=A0ABM7ZMG5_STRNI|nr:ATP-binding protein [Streptomyces nigrescens]BDM67505.1 ATP-binding protein [Streptomyces nigrescens]